MATSTPQSAAEFYDWALKRYHRRSVALTRTVIVMTLLAMLIGAVVVFQIRDLNAQNVTARADVERLHDQLVEARSTYARKNARTLAYVKCLESQTRKYAEGMNRLLRRKISIRVFLNKYEPKACS